MKRKWFFLVAVLVVLIGIAGFSSLGGFENKADKGNTAQASQDVVRIGTMNLVNGDLIAQYEKYYEKELGVKVELVNFKSGKDVNTALAAGSVDITQLGTAPVALGISTDVDYEVIGIGDIIGKAETLVAKNSSGVNSVADLKGKRVGVPFASTAHYSLLNALKLAGLSENDVQILDLQPNDIFAAWQRGDIDAAYIWYPVLSKLLEDGKAITDSGELAGKGVLTADLIVARTDYAKEHPDVVKKFIKTQLKANDVILQQPDTAVKEIASILNISEGDAKDQITQFKYLTGPEQVDYLTNKIPATLKSTADFLVTQKSIKQAPDLDTFKKRVTAEFVQDAVANK